MRHPEVARLSVIIPCFNEEKTLTRCVERVRLIADARLSLEIIIVDDGSSDQSLAIAQELERQYPEITVLRHARNQGKGAALRTGFGRATGEYVAVQDADLEYSPTDLRRLVVPLIDGDADVVFGSRFLSTGTHRVLYFWHAVGNSVLTLLSNMYTDLNLTDMETGYKVFRRDVIRRIELRENRFGVEPEIVAKAAHLRLRIYEMGISYRGRTYAEGKKVGIKDGVRALYCIFRYNAHQAPLPMQLLLYVLIGGASAVVNVLVFLGLFARGWDVLMAAPAAFLMAAMVNYALCITLLFRHRVRWNAPVELLVFLCVVCLVGAVDLMTTKGLLALGTSPVASKLTASAVGLILNFAGRRWFVFPERASGPWTPQEDRQGRNE